MSAMAQIEQRVRALIDAALDALTRHEKKQDDRLAAIEKRLDALEHPADVKAQAGTAKATGTARNAGSK